MCVLFPTLPIGLSLPRSRPESTSTMCASVVSQSSHSLTCPLYPSLLFSPILSLPLASICLRPQQHNNTPQMVLGTVILGVCYGWARHLGHIKTFCDISDLVVHLPERRCIASLHPHSTHAISSPQVLRPLPPPPAIRSTRRAALPHTASGECLGPATSLIEG